MKLRYGARTDVGRLRRANEDAYLAQEPLFAVADGMGGHTAGDVASATVVDVFVARAGDIRPQDLEDVVQEANAAVWERAQSDQSLRGMGTTCTAVIVTDGTAHLAHVGDSRAYLVRDGQLRQLTDDHTLVARMVREGRLTADEAERHPQRNVITRALGVEPDVQVDVFAVELEDGDRVLLCSDGLSSLVDGDTILDIVSSNRDPQAVADALVEAANAAGGEDNITVIVLEVGDEREGAAAPQRVDTEPEERRARSPAAGRGATPLVLAGLILVLVVAGGYLGARYALDNSWFVAANEQGVVTIYRGIPEEIAGFTLRTPEEETTIELEELPSFMQPDVAEGIKADSLEEARATVANLEQRARDFAGSRPQGTEENQP